MKKKIFKEKFIINKKYLFIKTLGIVIIRTFTT
jgi:hypothetical protein